MNEDLIEIPESQWDRCDPFSAAIRALVRAQNQVAAEHAKFAEESHGDIGYASAFAMRREAVGRLLMTAAHASAYEADYLDSRSKPAG
jgi:hypothetical protein